MAKRILSMLLAFALLACSLPAAFAEAEQTAEATADEGDGAAELLAEPEPTAEPTAAPTEEPESETNDSGLSGDELLPPSEGLSGGELLPEISGDVDTFANTLEGGLHGNELLPEVSAEVDTFADTLEGGLRGGELLPELADEVTALSGGLDATLETGLYGGELLDGEDVMSLMGEEDEGLSLFADGSALEGRFSYRGGGSAPYHYEDAYFAQSALQYNAHLATLSLDLSLTGGSYSGEPYQYSKAFLEALGFTGFDVNADYKAAPNENSMAVSAARKQIETAEGAVTLIALAPRGLDYGLEWSSNFEFGLTGDHAGYSRGRDKVLEFLKSYIAQQGVSGRVKVWISGYSRGGSVANLVAGSLDQGYDLGAATLAAEDLYAYTFGAPNVTVAQDPHGSQYGNIFNVVNPYDVIPYVVPSAAGFARYGTDVLMPTKEGNADYAALFEAMKDQFQTLAKQRTYKEFVHKKLTFKWLVVPTIATDTSNTSGPSQTYADVMAILTNEIAKGREGYVNNYEQHIRTLMEWLFATQGADLDGFWEALSTNLAVSSVDIYKDFRAWITGDTTAPLQRIHSVVVATMAQYGLPQPTFEETAAMAQAFIALFGEAIVWHPNYMFTMLSNIGYMVTMHQPETALAWMQSLDSNYADAIVRPPAGELYVQTIVLSSSKPTQGSSTTVTVSGGGSSTGNYYYQVLEVADYDLSNAVVVQPFSTSSSFRWKPTRAGNIQLVVLVADDTGAEYAFDVKELQVQASAKLSVTIAASADSQNTGTVTLTATPKGGASLVAYYFQITPISMGDGSATGETKELQAAGLNNVCAFKPLDYLQSAYRVDVIAFDTLGGTATASYTNLWVAPAPTAIPAPTPAPTDAPPTPPPAS